MASKGTVSSRLSVVIDASPITSEEQYRSGLARYSYDLVNGVLDSDNEVGINATGSIWSSQEVLNVSKKEGWNYVGKPLPKWVSHPVVAKGYNYLRSSISVSTASEYDLYHSTYARIRKDVRRFFKNRHLVTVHDLTPLKFSKAYFHANQKAITSRIINSIKSGDHVITVSDNTRQDLIAYRNLDPKTVYTVHNGFDPRQFYQMKDGAAKKQVLAPYQLLEDPYFMTLSALGKHKNIAAFLDAGRILDQQHPKQPFKLVIGGKPNVWMEELLKKYPSAFLEKRVIVIGFIPDEALRVWYSNCQGFVFPSLYEGFGLPLVEAMACGAPVIYANNSSLKEIGEGIGIPCDTMNAEMYADAMRRLLESDSLFNEQSEKSLAQSANFTQEKWINGTLDVYQKILNA